MYLVQEPVLSGEKPSFKSGFGFFLLTLLGSLVLTLLLSWIFHFPIFILAGFLPLLWRRRVQ